MTLHRPLSTKHPPVPHRQRWSTAFTRLSRAAPDLLSSHHNPSSSPPAGAGTAASFKLPGWHCWRQGRRATPALALAGRSGEQESRRFFYNFDVKEAGFTNPARVTLHRPQTIKPPQRPIGRVGVPSRMRDGSVAPPLTRQPKRSPYAPRHLSSTQPTHAPHNSKAPNWLLTNCSWCDLPPAPRTSAQLFRLPAPAQQLPS